MHIKYIDKRLAASTMETIDSANTIIEEYLRDGYTLTLRQLYYQFVARDLLPNEHSEYKRLGSIIGDGRLCGHIDWDAIEDRTRELEKLPHWNHPEDMVASAAQQMRVDLWSEQDYRVEVWVEKEALVGVFARVCDSLDVPYFACRGYPSLTAMWEASERFKHYLSERQNVVILHFGDHDPSGMDMTDDIARRLDTFGCNEEAEVMGCTLRVERLALNMDQVRKYKPPPNPTKLSDSRAQPYIDEYGESSWELDALEPKVLEELVSLNVDKYSDASTLSEMKRREREHREALSNVADDWDTALGAVREA